MSIYDRRMFRMANGGMMPPDPAMAMGPAMMPPPMPGGMPPMPGGMPGQLPPELMMATEDLSAQAGENMVEEELMGDIQQATDEGLEDINMAGDYRELMGAVWEENAPVEVYRQRLADVVGPGDAAQTPDSVLALVQPTLLMAQLDQGIGALMQEELAEVGDAGGGITELATQGAVVDGMAAETGALVNAVGNMAQGPRPMAPQEGIMDPMMMQAMMQGAGSMAPQEGMVDPMVTGPYA